MPRAIKFNEGDLLCLKTVCVDQLNRLKNLCVHFPDNINTRKLDDDIEGVRRILDKVEEALQGYRVVKVTYDGKIVLLENASYEQCSNFIRQKASILDDEDVIIESI